MQRNYAHHQQGPPNGNKKCKRNCILLFLFMVFPNIEIPCRRTWDPFPEKVVQKLCLEMDFRNSPQILEEAPRNCDFLCFWTPRFTHIGDFWWARELFKFLDMVFRFSWGSWTQDCQNFHFLVPKMSFFYVIFWLFLGHFLEPQNSSQLHPGALKTMFLWVKNQATSNPGGGFRFDWYD